MRFGLGYLGRIGNKKKLPSGQTLMHALGTAAVNFIAPTYTLMTATGSASVSFVGAGSGGGGGGTVALQTDMSSTTSEWMFIA